MNDDHSPAQDQTGPAQGTAAAQQTTDWKALARTWETRAKENRDNFEAAKASLDAWTTVFQDTKPENVKAKLNDLDRRLQATTELAASGASPKQAFDSISFMRGLSEATDITKYCKEWAGRTREVKPTGQNDNTTDHNSEALRLLLGK